MMKPLRERNQAAVGAVTLILLVVGVLAAFYSDRLPVIGGGTTYTATFAESAGIKPDNEVRIAGVKVGKVTDVSLAGNQVNISFRVKDAWLGDRTVVLDAGLVVDQGPSAEVLARDDASFWAEEAAR